MKCRDGEGGRPGGCRTEASVHVVGINPDGTECSEGMYCKYHSWSAARSALRWSGYADVERRDLTRTSA